MPKRYNTPHRSHVVKTRLTDEEYADFTERLAPYGISQSEFLRQAIRRTTICCSALSRKHPDCSKKTQKSGGCGRWLCSGRKNRDQFRRISPRKKSIGRDNVRRRLHHGNRRLSYSISCSKSAKRFDAKKS